MSKGGTKETQVQTTKTELPGWVSGASEANYGELSDATRNMAGPYQGPRVAPLTPGQTDIYGGLLSNVGSTSPVFAEAGATMKDAQGYNAGKLTPGMLRDTDLTPYENKYDDAVIQASNNQYDLGTRQALTNIGSQAAKAKAFGGSRQAVAEGAAYAKGTLDKASMVADLKAKGFLNAQGMATADINRTYEADKANEANRQAASGIRTSAATGAGNLATAGQNAFLTGSAAALAGQDAITAQRQREIDAEKALYDETRMDPIDRARIRMEGLGKSPYGQTATQTSPGPTSNTTASVMGGASSIIGMAGTVASMFSDRRAKTDIKKLGKDPKTGLTMYAYRYRDDPKTYPKVVGPMAQEVEKKFPGSTEKVGRRGHMTINLGFGVAA